MLSRLEWLVRLCRLILDSLWDCRSRLMPITASIRLTGIDTAYRTITLILVLILLDSFNDELLDLCCLGSSHRTLHRLCVLADASPRLVRRGLKVLIRGLRNSCSSLLRLHCCCNDLLCVLNLFWCWFHVLHNC